MMEQRLLDALDENRLLLELYDKCAWIEAVYFKIIEALPPRIVLMTTSTTNRRWDR